MDYGTFRLSDHFMDNKNDDKIMLLAEMKDISKAKY